MPPTPAEARPRPGAAGAALHQICVTHCAYGQGVTGQAGLGIRAASTDDPLLLRFALEFLHGDREELFAGGMTTLQVGLLAVAFASAICLALGIGGRTLQRSQRAL